MDESALTIIMDSNSDMSDIDESTDDEYMDITDKEDETDKDETDNENTPTTTSKPGPSRLRDLRNKYVWQSSNRQPQVTTFAGTQGLTDGVVINDIDCPYDYFKLFFNDSLMDLLVRETNLYASQYVTNRTLSPKARAQNWKPVTVEELKVFFGLVLLTGLLDKKGRLSSYWSKDPILSTPFFSQCMARDRFQLITSFLHFNNNEAMPMDCADKLYKIRPVFDILVDKWRSRYSLGEHIAIDEGMLKWRGRLSFRVYNKDKPTKYGIKAYILADSSSGYCWNMDIYHQEKKTLKETVHRLLTKKCTGLWHSLYMDNLYNSVELSEALLVQKIHTIGTLRKNRSEPSEITKKHMDRHDVIARDNGKVMVLAWKDKRIVKAISTKHDSSVTTISRRKKGGRGVMEEVEKPTCICDYNMHMSGVDHVDQMISYYPCTRKTLKWPKKVFFYLMEISVHNSHVLYQAKTTSKKMNLYDFQLKLIKELCRQSTERDISDDSSDVDDTPIKTPRNDPVRRLHGGFKSHHVTTYPPTARKAYPQRNCRICSKKGIRKDTRYFCKECKIPLCNTPCFANYHSNKNL